MSPPDLVAGLVAAYNEHDAERHASWYAHDATVHPAGWTHAVDVTAWISAFTLMLEAFPDLTVHPALVTSGSGVVIMEARLTGTNTGPLYLSDEERLILGTDVERLAPTGRTIDIAGAVVLEIADQRVTAERHYWPVVEPLVQLGLVEVHRMPV